eukprot:Selendium_serpulae@DN3504_c0_g1_i10.p1
MMLRAAHRCRGMLALPNQCLSAGTGYHGIVNFKFQNLRGPAGWSPPIQSCALPFANQTERWSSTSRSSQHAKNELLGALNSEARHEEQAYERPKAIYEVLEKTDWKPNMIPGDINMSLMRNAGGMNVTVDFQLSPPLQDDEVSDDSNGSGSPGREGDMTNFMVTATNVSGAGVRFYCSTIKGDSKYRFLIANIKAFADKNDKDSETAYNGPDFQDLDDAMQHTIDAWVADLGVNNELCEIIEGLATDKEQQEYMKWINDFIKALELE